jgi:hypothetical protein
MWYDWIKLEGYLCREASMERLFEELVLKGYTVRRIRHELTSAGFTVEQSDKELIAWMRKVIS